MSFKTGTEEKKSHKALGLDLQEENSMSKSGSSIMTLSSTVLTASHRPASKETDRSTLRGMHWFRLRPPEPPGRMHRPSMCTRRKGA